MEVALAAMAREQSAATTCSDIAAVSAHSATGQDRLATLNADRFFGPTSQHTKQYQNPRRSETGSSCAYTPV